jgi:hypothetical protein
MMEKMKKVSAESELKQRRHQPERLFGAREDAPFLSLTGHPRPEQQ